MDRKALKILGEELYAAGDGLHGQFQSILANDAGKILSAIGGALIEASKRMGQEEGE